MSINSTPNYQKKKTILMKKIHISKWVFGICILFFITNSCTDTLDDTPPELVDINRVLNREVVVRNFRSNSYNHLNTGFAGYTAGQLLDAYTDDAFRAGTTISYDWHNGLLSPANNMFANTIWDQYWQGIRKCNLAIQYLPQSRVSELLISQRLISEWLDEVIILRAWYHFELVRHFGPLPFVDNAYGPEFSDWESFTRPTYDQIITRIVEEIDGVIGRGNLPFRWQFSGDYNNINMAVAYALKSRVLLYNASPLNNPGNDQQKWNRAAVAARECLDAIAPYYELLPIEAYGRLFNENYNVLNLEVILRSANNDADVLNNNNGVDLRGLGSPTQSNNAGTVPSQELVDAFELTDGTMPVLSYINSSHTNVVFGGGYNEESGAAPYANRDARFYHAIVFNASSYGRYKGMPAGAPDLTIYTYDGKPFTGFNLNPTSDEENDRRRSTTGYYARKYRSAGYWGTVTGGVNANKIFFRVAEIYLNLAEAQCELGNLEEAMAALNVIRNRAGQPDIQDVPGFSQNRDYLMNRIRNERRVELCFEEHRFYDQRRWNILEQTNKTVSGMRIISSDGTDQGTFSYERIQINIGRNAFSEKYLHLPIPLEEARRLPGLGQPVGY
jgi:starch-binding outer membrane protein, SusD/RagB family